MGLVGRVGQVAYQAHQTDLTASMRFIQVYLLGYFILVIGAVLALWQAGVLGRISGIWLAISAVIVVGLGIMLAVSAGKPSTVARD